MNARLRIFALSLSVVALAACAGMPEKSAYTAPRTASLTNVDESYVAQVEQVARMRGVDVRWVNKPLAKTGNDD